VFAAAAPPPTVAGPRAATPLSIGEEEGGTGERTESLRGEGSEEREMDVRNEEKWVLHPFYTTH